MSNDAAESAFYAALASHYDELFGCGDSLVNLILDLLHANSKASVQAGAQPKVLDVACGTGACTRALVLRGVDAAGVDLSKHMIRHARDLARQREVDPRRFAVGDMLEVHTHPHAPLDLLFCVGNSISHLPSISAVERFLAAAGHALRPPGADEQDRGGTLVLQYVAAEAIPPGTAHRLSDLEAPGVRMERRYHRESEDAIRFDAALLTANEEPVRLSQRLLVIGDAALEDALSRTGFCEFERYGGFDRSPAVPGVRLRVVVARRGWERLR